MQLKVDSKEYILPDSMQKPDEQDASKNSTTVHGKIQRDPNLILFGDGNMKPLLFILTS
jgi:hypothetical protein